MNGWLAFRCGLSRVARYRWVLGILFVVNLASGMLLAALPGSNLLGPAHRPAIREAADGVDAWMLIELLSSSGVDGALGMAGAGTAPSWDVRQAVLSTLATMAALLLLAWLSSAFLSGGALLTYAEDDGFRWRRFLWGCWRWFGAFLLLGAAQAVVLVLLFLSSIVALAALAPVLGRWLPWALVPLLALLAVLWLALMEMTRAVAVVEGKRNVFRAFGGALRVAFRRPLAVGGLYGLALLLLTALHGLYRWGLMPRLPLNWWLLVFTVQQTFILARLGARLARWAGNAALYQGVRVAAA